MEIIFHSHTNKTPFHKKGCELFLILKVRVFGTRKWPINFLYCFLVVVVVEYIFLAINSVLTHICYICSTHNWNVLVCCLRDCYEQRGWLLSKYKAPLYRKNLQLYKRKILCQNLQIYHSQQHNLGTYDNVTETGHSRVPRTPIFKTRRSVKTFL